MAQSEEDEYITSFAVQKLSYPIKEKNWDEWNVIRGGMLGFYERQDYPDNQYLGRELSDWPDFIEKKSDRKFYLCALRELCEKSLRPLNAAYSHCLTVGSIGAKLSQGLAFPQDSSLGIQGNFVQSRLFIFFLIIFLHLFLSRMGLSYENPLNEPSLRGVPECIADDEAISQNPPCPLSEA